MLASLVAVHLESETDFEGWRRAARSLRLNEVPPDAVVWRIGEAGGLFDGAPPPEPPGGMAFVAPKAFVDLAQDVVLNRAEDRFDLLYRLLWRLREAPHLLAVVTDADVARARLMQKQVRDAEHKMHAFLRFRLVAGPGGTGDPSTVETYVAWFEPAHRVVERGAAFFVERMANLRFSILTPELCAHWNGETLAFTPGVDRSEAPDEDALEGYWRTYFASVFNPARVNPALMAQHMPRRYWRNLPEAEVISELVQQAQGRTAAMVQSPPTEPSARMRRRDASTGPKPGAEAVAADGAAAKLSEPELATLSEVAAGAQACRRCELWANATQAVPGAGPPQAPLMFVGEQPGDMEDLRGLPFIGPAGQLLDRALAQAGVPRDATYVTNAVKHFKWEPRGKRRLHSKPNAGEIKACRWWLDQERRLVQPRVIVALGATAATSVFGRAISVTKERGSAGALEHGATGFITVHPSYLLRLPDEAAKAAEFDRFVRDLAQAWSLAQAA